ncbi:MAG: NEW3 domain-containing protein [Candidatus Micrarchaeia archaeon]
MINGKMFGTLALFALALLLLSGSASASINPKVQLLNYTLSSVPAQPGQTLALTLHMKSMEPDNCAESVSVQVSVSYPLSVLGSDTQYLPLLCFRDADSAGDFTFLFPVDNLATSGTYPVSVSTAYEKRFTKLTESNTVNVQVGGAPSFNASVTSSTPVDIYPGDTAKVAVTFQNTGSSMVQSARATASSQGIAVKWAGSTQDLGSIAARASATAYFSVEAPKDMAAGSYPLDVVLAYTSENRSMGSTSFRFMVPISPKADFAAASASPVLVSGEKKEVAITLSNTGSQEARKLKVRIKPLFPFSTDGTVRYIDSLPAGASTNVTYLVTVDKDATAGEQLLGFQIDFEDQQGKQMSDTADFSLSVRALTLLDQLASVWYVWVVLALVIVYLALKGMGGKKKEKAA